MLLGRVLADHLPVMQAETESKEEVRAQTSSVKTTNTISERDFAIFDRLLREKPHASTLALEAHILFANNKTSEWLTKKSKEEKCKIMEEARKNAPQHRRRYHHRISVIEEAAIEQQHKKEKEKEKSAKQQLQAKEKITTDIIDYGLWQSASQLAMLDGIKSETKKREVIKAQLRFRKTVLQQKVPDMSVYQFSSKEKGPFTSTMLRENLLKLIQAADTEASSSSSSSLTGKVVKHRFQDAKGKLKYFKGRIISQVPGFPEWFNLVYDKEPGIVYSYKLSEDLENGDLQIL